LQRWLACKELIPDLLTWPAQAHAAANLVAQIADQPFEAAFLPPILVPIVGLVFPAVAMASLFLYIEADAKA
jgi:photosystem I subunit 8